MYPNQKEALDREETLCYHAGVLVRLLEAHYERNSFVFPPSVTLAVKNLRDALAKEKEKSNS